MTCLFCGKAISRMPALEHGYHEGCRKRSRKVRLTEDQKTCYIRSGRCWANPSNPTPCLLGIIMEHTDCRISSTKELVKLNGNPPDGPKNWGSLWTQVTEVSKQEEELEDIVFSFEEEDEEPNSGDLLKLAELRARRTALLEQIEELRR